MDSFSLQEAVRTITEIGQLPALGVLAGSSVLEYVFPPFPGDTVTLAGGVLARAGGWSFGLVFLVLTAGSMAGASLDYWFGAKALAREKVVGRAKTERSKGAVNRVLDGYKRFGPAFLVLNRFMPGIRGLFFVAAGMAGIPFRKVVFYSTVSAAAWNGLILFAGYAVGDNLALLESLFKTYMGVVWTLMGAGVVAWVVVRLRAASRR